MTNAPDFNLLPSSTLIDAEVSAAHGELLGHARQLLIVLNTGRIQYVVLETALEDKSGSHVLVPWAALKWNAERECLMLDISAERLAEAPAFAPLSSAAWNQADWRQKVDRYYGVEPGWEKPENYTG